MTQPTRPQLPIGYWLKRADEVITEHVNAVQTANGVSRTDWQVLNMLHEAGGASKERLFETMRTFIDAAGLDEIIARLMNRGWIEQSGESASGAAQIQLTDEGRHRHAEILSLQKEVRRRAVQGVSEEEYAMVIRVLQRIVANLEGDGEGPNQHDSAAA